MYMNAFLYHRIFDVMILVLDRTKVLLFPLPFYIQIKIYRQDWERGYVHGSFEMLVGSNL